LNCCTDIELVETLVGALA